MKTEPNGLDDLQIALNSHPRLSRPAVYRLAQELERWLGSREPPERLAGLVGVPRAQLEKALALAGRPDEVASSAAREREEAARLGAGIVLAGEPAYPAALRHLSLPPPVLTVRGELPPGISVAIVGSRKADPYGREVAELFARALAAAGMPVVSGFARGVDAAAHRGALSAPEGRTVAVLGCGLGVDYPVGHAALGKEISERGALLSEFPCGAGPRAWHFPVRNRVIAALSAGTLVVQAAPRSGSLVTARHALDLGRHVWAVPGRIFDDRSIGPNALIRDGAALVQHPREILEEILGVSVVAGAAGGTGALPLFDSIPEPEPEPPPGLAGQVFSALPSGSSRAPEEVAAAVGLPVDQVLGALLELELEGLVKRIAGGVYGR
ncbi:MAG TPA: DNA-processing protein DprA [Thermoanaerobaculia bacterium]|nr:DNA-processing protein DprA [Thermoanaerobaculia bacterium]